ncbi:hypothetical protein VNO77_43142 [Canavalia gladiata]|uniref:Uncharacterized protein n=1 Tax=Canavalia gladiata TaxID=3824 RepID=A0AAN9PMN3_CANGL
MMKSRAGKTKRGISYPIVLPKVDMRTNTYLQGKQRIQGLGSSSSQFLLKPLLAFSSMELKIVFPTSPHRNG